MWFPTWSLARPDAPSGEPFLVVDDRVAGASEEVLTAGVTLGMPRREAEALAPFAVVLSRDPGEEARRFEPVVALVEDLVPRVEVVAPGLMYLPVTGALRFYGTEQDLAKRVATALTDYFREVVPPIHIGIADGPFAARWAAATATGEEPVIVSDTREFLSRLDLGTLREAMGGEEMIDTFRWLGIVTLGDLARLPRDTLLSRFGNPGLVAHRLANGEDRPVDPATVLRDLARGLSADSVVPVLLGVAERDMGVRRLLRAVVEEVPDAAVTAERLGIAQDGPPLVQVLKTYHVPHAGKLSLARVWRG